MPTFLFFPHSSQTIMYKCYILVWLLMVTVECNHHLTAWGSKEEKEIMRHLRLHKYFRGVKKQLNVRFIFPPFGPRCKACHGSANKVDYKEFWTLHSAEMLTARCLRARDGHLPISVQRPEQALLPQKMKGSGKLCMHEALLMLKNVSFSNITFSSVC